MCSHGQQKSLNYIFIISKPAVLVPRRSLAVSGGKVDVRGALISLESKPGLWTELWTDFWTDFWTETLDIT